MSVDPRFLQSLCSDLCPDLKTVINHKSSITSSTWEKGLQTGKAIEFTSLCALISTFRAGGFRAEVPEFYLQNPDAFYVRNTIPRHHGALAGHDAAVEGEMSLVERFRAALAPRVKIYTQAPHPLLIFREGHPFHAMHFYKKHRDQYLERPDLVISEGSVRMNIHNNELISFDYVDLSGIIEGSLRIMNSPTLPFKSLKCSDNFDISVLGLIECSVGKDSTPAERQLTSYKALFGSKGDFASLLVNGRRAKAPKYNCEISLDLEDEEGSSLRHVLDSGMKLFVNELLKSSEIDRNRPLSPT